MTKATNENVTLDSSIRFCNQDGGRMPVVFLHGNGFNKDVFTRQFESSALKDHPLMAIDLAGHGSAQNADDPKITYSFEGLASNISTRLKGKFDRPYIVAGWSLGGHVAIEMLDDPLVAGVFAFGAPPAPQGPIGIIRAFHINRMLLLAGKAKFTRADAEYFEDAALGGLTNHDFVEAIIRTDPEFRPNLSRGMITGAGTSQRERVMQANKPICLLNGENDLLVRGQYLEGFSAPVLYGEKPITLEGCGHAPFLQAQFEFENVLTDFADQIETGKLQPIKTFSETLLAS